MRAAHVKRIVAFNGRRHGLRARLAWERRTEKTVLTFERRAQVYCWSTDRGRAVLKH